MFDPKSTLVVPIYESDKGNPAAPAVKVKYVTAREMIEVWRLQDEARELLDTEKRSEAVAKLGEVLGLIVVGVVNLPDVTTPQQLADVVSYNLLWDLATRCPKEVALNEQLGKQSGLPAPTTPASSSNTPPAPATESAAGAQPA